MPRKPSVPTYRRKGGRAVVSLFDTDTQQRHDISLGEWDSATSRENYHRIIAEWLAAGRRIPQQEGKPARPDPRANLFSVAQLCVQYMEDRLTKPICHGDLTSLKLAIRILVDHYGRQPAESIGPNALRALRMAMTKAGRQGWTRGFVTKAMGMVKRIFKWGVGHELIDPRVIQAQGALESVRAGTEGFREGRKITPPPDFMVEASLKHLPPELVAVVRLQQLTGGRPSELLGLTPGDFDGVSQDGVWIVELGKHKTAYKGKRRTLIFGPRAQGILEAFVAGRPDDEFLFKPSEVVARRRAIATENRKTPAGQGNAVGTHRQIDPKRVPGDRYDAAAYGRAIIYACRKAFPPPEHLRRQRGESRGEWKARLGAQWAELLTWEREHRWFPYQLRHGAATEIRRQVGPEEAAIVLGHSSMTLTDAVYAERDLNKAVKVMAAIG